MDGSRDYHVKQNNPVSQRQVLHFFPYTWNLGEEKVHGSRRGNRKGVGGVKKG
jgi:hypothetical protein